MNYFNRSLSNWKTHFADLGGHALAMGAFGTLGYWLHGVEHRQNELIALKKEQILKNRERLAARSEEKNRSGQEE